MESRNRNDTDQPSVDLEPAWSPEFQAHLLLAPSFSCLGLPAAGSYLDMRRIAMTCLPLSAPWACYALTPSLGCCAPPLLSGAACRCPRWRSLFPVATPLWRCPSLWALPAPWRCSSLVLLRPFWGARPSCRGLPRAAPPPGLSAGHSEAPPANISA